MNEKWLKGRQEIHTRLYWVSLASCKWEQKQVTGSLVCSLRWGEGGYFLPSIEWLAVSPGMEGWLRWFVHSLHGWVQEGMTPSFFFRLFRNSRWNFLFLSLCVFRSKICLNCTCRQLILVSYNFFIFCSLRRGFPGVSFVLHQRVWGPRPVSIQ